MVRHRVPWGVVRRTLRGRLLKPSHAPDYPPQKWLFTQHSNSSRACPLCVARDGDPCQPRRWPVTRTGLSCSTTYLTIRTCPSAIPAFTLLAAGHDYCSAAAPFKKWCSLRGNGSLPVNTHALSTCLLASWLSDARSERCLQGVPSGRYIRLWKARGVDRG